jgi:hypothetical protein
MIAFRAERRISGVLLMDGNADVLRNAARKTGGWEEAAGTRGKGRTRRDGESRDETGRVGEAVLSRIKPGRVGSCRLLLGRKLRPIADREKH